MAKPMLTPIAIAEFQNEQRIGSILLQSGKLNDKQIQEILERQIKRNCSFGAAAIDLGYLVQMDIDLALCEQFGYEILKQTSGKPHSNDLIAALDPFGIEAESFRALRSRLMLQCFEKGRRALAIVSPVSGSGSTYVAANLSISLAQLGLNICLVDANLRRPRINKIFGMSSSVRGLSDVLRRKDGYDELIVDSRFPGLAILPVGHVPPNPQELISSRAFVNLVTQILREYDVAIFDTPAANTCADGRLISARVGNALLVTRTNHTLAHDVQVLSGELKSSGCELVGSVLNNI